MAKLREMLKQFNSVNTVRELLHAVIEDIRMSMFLLSRIGKLTGVVKSFLVYFFIKSAFPLFIGKRSKILHPSHISLGRCICVKDDVVLIANGEIKTEVNSVIAEKSTLRSQGSALYIGRVYIYQKDVSLSRLQDTFPSAMCTLKRLCSVMF